MTNQRYRNTYVNGCSHFCTASATGFLPLFLDDRACRLIAGAWQRYRLRFVIALEGFVIMPEHIHLLLRGTGEGVRKFMQYSLSQSSRDVRMMLETEARRGSREAAESVAVIHAQANGASVGKVWKKRFRCVALDREDAVLVKLNYIHNNPVKRGLVEHPNDWKWSSSSYYSGLPSVLPVDIVFACGD